MNALRLRSWRRISGGLIWAAVALVALEPTRARADTFKLTYDDTEADPAETFEEDCLGDVPADDCDTRAALMEGELVTLLSRLESDPAPETAALFQAALELDSPVVHALAVQYLSRASAQPEDFLSRLKTFFFGPDAPLGVSSSAALQASSEETDQQLAKLYFEQRPESAYAPQPIREDASEHPLLDACIKDARLERMPSFGEAERFVPAERLLMYDRFVRASFEAGVDYPVTAFVTDASVADVSEFFTQRFGEPYGPVANSQERVLELTQQLLSLQGAAASGDPAALDKIRAIVDELEQAQLVTSLDAYLQLSAIHADKDRVWLEGDLQGITTRVPRAVTVGEDPLLGKTVIRYINAPSGSPDVDPGDGSAGDRGAGGGGGNAGAGGVASGDPTRSGSGDGCGCAVPGVPQKRGGLAALAMLAACAWRARRRHRSADPWRSP